MAGVEGVLAESLFKTSVAGGHTQEGAGGHTQEDAGQTALGQLWRFERRKECTQGKGQTGGQPWCAEGCYGILPQPGMKASVGNEGNRRHE